MKTDKLGEYNFIDFEWNYILSNPDAIIYREPILSWLIDYDFSTIDLEE